MRFEDNLMRIALEIQEAKLDFEEMLICREEYLTIRKKLKEEIKTVLRKANDAGFPTPISSDSYALLNLEI